MGGCVDGASSNTQEKRSTYQNSTKSSLSGRRVILVMDNVVSADISCKGTDRRIFEYNQNYHLGCCPRYERQLNHHRCNIGLPFSDQNRLVVGTEEGLYCMDLEKEGEIKMSLEPALA